MEQLSFKGNSLAALLLRWSLTSLSEGFGGADYRQDRVGRSVTALPKQEAISAFLHLSTCSVLGCGGCWAPSELIQIINLVEKQLAKTKGTQGTREAAMGK